MPEGHTIHRLAQDLARDLVGPSPLEVSSPQGRFHEAEALSGTRLVGSTCACDLRGPTCCEIIDDDARAELLARLGADPLAATADPKPAWARIKKSSRPIGAMLLDQRIFSGLGNVYRAEILFMLRIHPETPSNTLTKRQFDAIWKLARELLARGVKEKRIVTRPAVKGKRLRRDEALHIYARRSCDRCGDTVRRWTVGARAVYACETCQPPPIAST